MKARIIKTLMAARGMTGRRTEGAGHAIMMINPAMMKHILMLILALHVLSSLHG